jgi:5'-methylthioadenosine phosphorylase
LTGLDIPLECTRFEQYGVRRLAAAFESAGKPAHSQTERGIPMAKIGVIGGSGFYRMEGIHLGKTFEVSTPFGKPSAPLQEAEAGGVELVFLARHGIGHRYNPSCVPYQANVYALKSVGVTHIVSVSAVGSLREDIEPLHLVVPDQIIDRTRSRPNTFFDPIAIHAGFADPFCPCLRRVLVRAIQNQGLTVHDGGTYICMEGPLFSTKAESALHRSWGASIVGMTALPEAKLAREAEICYATIALATDYDVWHEEMVSVDVVIERMQKNVSNVQRVLRGVFPAIAELAGAECDCRSALRNAILSDLSTIPEDRKAAFRLLLGKYIDLG